MKKEYIGNAKIIDKSRLPQVGTLCRNYYIDKKYCEDKICIEIKIKEFVEDYIIYEVKYCDINSMDLLDDLYTDCSTWTYAIKIKDL